MAQHEPTAAPAGGVARLRKVTRELDRPALLRALRAALLIPAAFAGVRALFGPEAGLFAAFGAFALLLFVEFHGSWRTRLVAYLALSGAGAGLIALGTLCSSRVETAVGGMVLVGFGVVFAGAINGYFAAATTAALLTFVLPVTIPATTAPMADRLIGWLFACAVSIPAVLLLWPPRARDELRAATARACSALADELAATGSPDSWSAQERSAAVQRSTTALAALTDRAMAAPYRTTGPTAADLALVSLVDEVRWLPPFVRALSADPPAEADVHQREARAAAATALHAAAGVLVGDRERPDLSRLDAAREALMGQMDTSAADLLRPGGTAVLDTVFRLQAVTSLARTIAALAPVAVGAARPGREGFTIAPTQAAEAALRNTARTLRVTGGIAVDLASPRAVWFRNSLRAGVGLGLAVFVAQVADLQHAFWAVLGTLSVLRSSALVTSRTALRAVAGTLIGLVVGGALVVVVGTSASLLWVSLPVAVFLAGYGTTRSFVAGQAAFTITIVVLFNLIQPEGWRVGLIRVEDVVVGCVVAVVVGLLFWPRGAARVLSDSLATAYGTGAELFRASGRYVLEGEPQGDVAEAERAARTAYRRLDDAFRQYVAERGTAGLDVATLSRAVSGVSRLRLTAESLDRAGRAVGTSARPDGCARLLGADLASVHRWYAGAADALAGDGPVPDPGEPAVERTKVLRTCLGGDDGTGLHLLWAGEYVEELRRLEVRIAGPIAAVAQASTVGWWR